MPLLIERRIDLMNHFRFKKMTYLTEYYDSKKHQFVYIFSRFLSNLRVRSTQRTKNNHFFVKNVINRHIFIQDDVRKIIKKIQSMFIDQKTYFNNQRHKIFKLMNRKIFARIKSLIIHETIDLIIREGNLTKKGALKIKKNNEQSFFDHDCLMNCDLFLQYKLPCKCGLYDCIVEETSISISLIHSRGLFDGSKYVAHGQMNFIFDFVAFAFAFSTSFEFSLLAFFASGIISNRYEDRGRILMKSIVIQSIDLQFIISNAELAEEFAQKY